MQFIGVAALIIAGLFLGMLLAAEFGRRLGLARIAQDAEGLPRGAGAAEAAVFALLGLLLAFTFSGAASRFEGRRHLVTEEANDIGTAYLRIDLLPADAQPAMRDLFRRYVDVRIATYANGEDRRSTQANIAQGNALQASIWRLAVDAAGRPGVPPQVAVVLLPALNEMFDITTTRWMATRNHPPPAVFLLVVGLSLVGALLVGYGTSTNGDRSWLHTVTFATTLALTIYVIVDLEFPRMGLIRVDASDQVLVDLRRGMG